MPASSGPSSLLSGATRSVASTDGPVPQRPGKRNPGRHEPRGPIEVNTVDSQENPPDALLFVQSGLGAAWAAIVRRSEEIRLNGRGQEPSLLPQIAKGTDDPGHDGQPVEGPTGTGANQIPRRSVSRQREAIPSPSLQGTHFAASRHFTGGTESATSLTKNGVGASHGRLRANPTGKPWANPRVNPRANPLANLGQTRRPSVAARRARDDRI